MAARRHHSKTGGLSGLVAAVLISAFGIGPSSGGDRFWLTAEEIEERYKRLRELEVSRILDKHEKGELLTEDESSQAIRYLISKGMREIRERERESEAARKGALASGGGN